MAKSMGTICKRIKFYHSKLHRAEPFVVLNILTQVKLLLWKRSLFCNITLSISIAYLITLHYIHVFCILKELYKKNFICIKALVKQNGVLFTLNDLNCFSISRLLNKEGIYSTYTQYKLLTDLHAPHLYPHHNDRFPRSIVPRFATIESKQQYHYNML